MIKERRSIRRFLDQPVGQAVIERLLLAACRAPSAHNRQPWRFAILPPGPRRGALVARMSARFRSDLEADGLPAGKVDELVDRGRTRMLEAPVLIVLFLTMEDMDSYSDHRRQAAEHTMAVQSVALAGGHILLAAKQEGLGACWVCAPLFVPEIVRDELGLPESWEAQGLIIAGHPADQGRDRTRKALKEVARWL